MGRRPRIQFPGAIYHVFARGIDRQPVFTDRGDYERFIESLVSAIERTQFELWCYALMDNHYHLLIRTPNGNLVQALHALQNKYVKMFNAAHNRVGPLFQGRYKSLVVADESYLMELSRYIHLNPYRKHLEKKLGRYEWSSYRTYCGLDEPKAWLRIEALLSRFGSTREEAFAGCRAFVEAGKNLSEWSPFDAAVEGFILGSKKLLRQLLKSSDPSTISLGKGVQRSKLYTPAEIVAALVKKYGVSENAIRSRQRSRTPLRSAAIYLSRRHTTWSLSRLGHYFGDISYGAVAKTCRECERRIKESEDDELSRIISSVQPLLE